MSSSSNVPIYVAIVAGTIAFISALVNSITARRGQKRDRRRQQYSEALAAIDRYEALPGRLEQGGKDGDSTQALLSEVADLRDEVVLFEYRLDFDAQSVATAYRQLVKSVLSETNGRLTSTWSNPVPTADIASSLGRAASPEVVRLREACVHEMQLRFQVFRRTRAFWRRQSRRRQVLLACIVLSVLIILADIIALNVAGEVSSAWWVLSVPVGLFILPLIGIVCVALLLRDRRRA